MITINLSEKQARELLDATGWERMMPKEVQTEIFRQLEHKLIPNSSNSAEIAVFMHEAGYRAKAVEDWKRKNEVML